MRKYFVTGLVTLLPLAITIWVVRFVVNFLTKPFIGMVTGLTHRLLLSPHLTRLLSQLVILLGLFLLMLFLGIVARKFFFGQMIRLGDRLLHRIPLVNRVYKTSKELVKSLFGANQKALKQVVMLPFPYPGCYVLGLVAKESPHTCSKSQKEPLLSVFIPTTPNPSSGFLVLSHQKDLIYMDMKVEEALKYVVSCAVIQPQERRT